MLPGIHYISTSLIPGLFQRSTEYFVLHLESVSTNHFSDRLQKLDRVLYADIYST